MATLTVTYPNSEGATLDFDYYMNSHVPLFMSVAGDYVTSASVSKGEELLGEPPPYLLVTHVELSDADAFVAAFAANAQDLMADIAKFTNTAPTLQLGSSL